MERYDEIGDITDSVMSKSLGSRTLLSAEMIQLLSLIEWQGYLLFPSAAERESQPECPTRKSRIRPGSSTT